MNDLSAKFGSFFRRNETATTPTRRNDPNAWMELTPTGRRMFEPSVQLLAAPSSRHSDPASHSMRPQGSAPAVTVVQNFPFEVLDQISTRLAPSDVLALSASGPAARHSIPIALEKLEDIKARQLASTLSKVKTVADIKSVVGNSASGSEVRSNNMQKLRPEGQVKIVKSLANQLGKMLETERLQAQTVLMHTSQAWAPAQREAALNSQALHFHSTHFPKPDVLMAFTQQCDAVSKLPPHLQQDTLNRLASQLDSLVGYGGNDPGGVFAQGIAFGHLVSTIQKLPTAHQDYALFNLTNKVSSLDASSQVRSFVTLRDTVAQLPNHQKSSSLWALSNLIQHLPQDLRHQEFSNRLAPHRISQ